MPNLQKLLDTYNPDFDPNSEASQKRRAQFQEDPAKDVQQYVGKYKHSSTYNHPSLKDDSFNSWFDTPLSSTEEPGYQEWEKKNVPQPLDPRYDMQGYYKDLVEKGKSETGINPIDHKLHFTDVYKKPSYPTFSNESKYATGPFSQVAGRWEGEQFVPPGVPTEGQEALQNPRIDPVYLLAGGLMGGMPAVRGGIFSQLLSGEKRGKVLGLPGNDQNGLVNWLNRLLGYAQTKVGDISNMPPPEF